MNVKYMAMSIMKKVIRHHHALLFPGVIEEAMIFKWSSQTDKL